MGDTFHKPTFKVTMLVGIVSMIVFLPIVVFFPNELSMYERLLFLHVPSLLVLFLAAGSNGDIVQRNTFWGRTIAYWMLCFSYALFGCMLSYFFSGLIAN